MASNYERIRSENVERYGKATAHLELLASLYADRTQFLFELLQNAEDTGATWVQFELFADTLEVRHNGHPFTSADVEGITGIGRGVKQDDLTQIGKFGIGFKSVYAYTQSPQVHSGDENFEITGFVQPFAIDPIGSPDTVFVFPLNRREIPAEQAHRELTRALLDFSPRNLLFLSHIEQIDCKIGGNQPKSRSLWRRNSAFGELRKAEVFSFLQGSALTSENWLIDSRTIPFPDGSFNGRENQGRIEAAFALRESRRGGFEIDCLPAAPLYVFFPTARTTHLGFLLQGPFRTTPARDNVPGDDPWNQQLIAESGALLRQAMRRLGRCDLTSASLLRALPLRAALFPKGSIYRPLYDSVLRSITEEPHLPARHSPAVSAARAKMTASRGLRDLFSPDQLGHLFGEPHQLDWVSGDVTEARNPELFAYLKDEAGVEVVTLDLVLDRLTDSFLSHQSDDWIASLYALLADYEDRGGLRFHEIIRLEDGRHVSSRPGTAFLPGQFSDGMPTVRRAILANADAVSFLRRMGIAEPEPADTLRRLLGPAPSEATRQRFLELWALTPEDAKPLIVGELRPLPFFEAVNARTGDRMLRRADETYLRSLELAAFFGDSPDVWYLADESMTELAERCGGTRAPRTEAGALAGLDGFLAHPAESGSRALWSLLTHLAPTVDLASPPKWIQLLRETPWLPASSGLGWAKPSELGSDQLGSGFAQDEAISRLLRMRDSTVAEAAAALGIPAATLRFVVDNIELIENLRLTETKQPTGM